MKNNINIVYEDNHLLVVEKPVNIPVQEDSSKDKDLLTILKEYIKEKYNKPGNVYLGLVHRLDRPVGGIMVFAKTSKCASRLSEQIRTNKMKKEYHAVIEGVLKSKGGKFEDYLLKDEKTNIVTVNEKGKYSALTYKVIKEVNNYSLVKILLETGRSHQIRVQFSSRGYPLYGDHKYNKNVKNDETLALFASSISFYHPITKKLLTFDLDIPNSGIWKMFK